MRRTTSDQYTRQSEMIQDFLTEVAEEHGAASEFVKRRSKLNAVVFAQTLILGMLEAPEATLNDLVQLSERLGVTISEPGFHGRINDEAVELLKRLLASSLKQFAVQGDVPAAVVKQFTRIDLLDSTQITLPKALAAYFAGHNSPGTEAALKIQLSVDYRSGQLNTIRIGPGREPDQRCDIAVQLATPGSLQVFDMGYAVLSRLRRIAERGAYFLTPLKTRTNVYASPRANTPLDLAHWLEKQADAQGRVDCVVYVGAEDRLPVRLVAYRLSQAQTEQRRRQARRNAQKKKRNVTKRHLQLLAWGLMITNVPAAMLSVEALIMLYRVRWQIELFFKLCKSQFRLAQVGPWRVQRLLCQCYARLIGVVLFQWLIVPWRFLDTKELSPPKAFRILRRHILPLVDALLLGGTALAALLADLRDAFLRHALKSQRKKAPSTFALLAQLEVQVA